MKTGLGLSDTDSWNMIEKIAEKNNLGYKQLVSNLAFNMIFKEGVNHPLSFVLTS